MELFPSDKMQVNGMDRCKIFTKMQLDFPRVLYYNDYEK